MNPKKFYLTTILLALLSISIGQNVSALNPEKFSQFVVRKRAQSNKSTKVLTSNYSSLQYIQPQSQIQIRFLPDSLKKYGSNIKLKISATLINKNGEERPLEVFGYSNVKTSNNPQRDDLKSLTQLDIKYEISYKEIDGQNLIDTEVDVSSLNLSEGDRIKIVLLNTKNEAKVGHTIIFEIDNFGFQGSATGGFSWLKTLSNNTINYKPSPNLGWSFKLVPNKGQSVGAILFTPSFGPELTVVDYNNQTTFGLGFQISELSNTIKLGFGFLANYSEKNRSYFTIGLNFIDGINTIKALKDNK